MKTHKTGTVYLLLFLLSSCYVYKPQIADIPLIQEKGDLHIDAAISLLPIEANTTVSYGVTEKLAIQVYGSIGQKYYMQGALGYYKDIGNNKVVEMYFGGGYGSGVYWADAILNGNGIYQLYFNQINFGKLNNKFENIDYGLGIKTGLLHTDYNRNDLDLAGMIKETYREKHFLFEPNVFIRLGKKNTKFNFKIGAFWVNNAKDKVIDFPDYPINVSIGINHRF